MKLSVWLDDIASSEGLDRGRYFISEEEFAQEQQIARQQAINDQVQQGLVQQELQPK
jgi:predicted transcriptional regulator